VTRASDERCTSHVLPWFLHARHEAQLTPSFFCSDEDDVVYWNKSFLPGYTIL